MAGAWRSLRGSLAGAWLGPGSGTLWAAILRGAVAQPKAEWRFRAGMSPVRGAGCGSVRGFRPKTNSKLQTPKNWATASEAKV